jgi:SAM-dependent methyltransferase
MKLGIMKEWLHTIKNRILPDTLPKPCKSPVDTIKEEQSQNLSPYWDPQFADGLETWGDGNAWLDIQMLVSGCHGKILDIACGTGKVIEILDKYSTIDIYGCDISDYLIQKAILRGIPRTRLCICNATHMPYSDNFFNYAYSIGSLEHFTEDGIEKCISECYRTTKMTSFHLVPVSRSGLDDGWMTTIQSYHNNSMNWWLRKFSSRYKDIVVLDSRWNDDRSVGKWFICLK